MLKITITGCLTGHTAALYQLPQKGGQLRHVMAYWARATTDDAGQLFWFSVVRDTRKQVFDNLPHSARYGIDGECPPHGKEPYQGNIREDGPIGFRIELCEQSLGCPAALMGSGPCVRENIQIHFGPATSDGCFLVAGRRSLYHKNFVSKIRAIWRPGDEIRVYVEPREFPVPARRRRRL